MNLLDGGNRRPGNEETCWGATLVVGVVYDGFDETVVSAVVDEEAEIAPRFGHGVVRYFIACEALCTAFVDIIAIGIEDEAKCSLCTRGSGAGVGIIALEIENPCYADVPGEAQACDVGGVGVIAQVGS